jgi:hypothetical protein
VGVPVVNCVEAGLAVLIALRYSPDDARDEYVLGWTKRSMPPGGFPRTGEAIRTWVADWLAARGLLAAVAHSSPRGGRRADEPATPTPPGAAAVLWAFRFASR